MDAGNFHLSRHHNMSDPKQIELDVLLIYTYRWRYENISLCTIK